MERSTPGSFVAELPLRILLADDDFDDRYFFDKVLRSIPLLTELAIVEDGELLMSYLADKVNKLPDVLFLDLNMPKKNGAICLSEIKKNKALKHIPVIIYSTHLHEQNAELLYDAGAHYYIRKTDMFELTKIIYRLLILLMSNPFSRPSRKQFIFTNYTSLETSIIPIIKRNEI